MGNVYEASLKLKIFEPPIDFKTEPKKTYTKKKTKPIKWQIVTQQQLSQKQKEIDSEAEIVIIYDVMK